MLVANEARKESNCLKTIDKSFWQQYYNRIIINIYLDILLRGDFMKQYEEPKAEVINFENDIITSSNSDPSIVPTHSGGSND